MDFNQENVAALRDGSYFRVGIPCIYIICIVVTTAFNCDIIFKYNLIYGSHAQWVNANYSCAVQFENSLGRLTSSNVHSPRQIIDVHADSLHEKEPVKGHELRRLKQILLDIEKVQYKLCSLYLKLHLTFCCCALCRSSTSTDSHCRCESVDVDASPPGVLSTSGRLTC